MRVLSLDSLSIIAFTHKTVPLGLLGKLVIEEEQQPQKLGALKESLGLSEFMYLSTCNRVEFILSGNSADTRTLLDQLGTDMDHTEIEQVVAGAEVYRGDEAVKHLFKVSASLDSMVIGEREIITQVRKAYERAAATGLSGEMIRLAVRKTIETAKEVFTETSIFKKPVSVVSLAFHRLRELDAPLSSRVLIIGAGKTNKAMVRFLSKHGYKNITIFNRTAEKARLLAEETGCSWAGLEQIGEYQKGFDILVACTGSGNAIVNKDLWRSLLNGETGRKIVIDLAVPGDVDKAAYEDSGIIVKHIDVEELRTTADKNLADRARDISKCEEIIDRHLLSFHDMFKSRQIELAMRAIPEKVKEIKDTALNSIYAREIESMSPESREVLQKVVSYLEKKYISVPMKMAREVMLHNAK